MDGKQLDEWLHDRGEHDDLLYERFGGSLESRHAGEFVAIADDGRTIVGPDEIALAQQAVNEFGRGKFALRRIGATAEMSWRVFR